MSQCFDLSSYLMVFMTFMISKKRLFIFAFCFLLVSREGAIVQI